MGLVMRLLGSLSLVATSYFMLCGCEERLSEAAKRLPDAQAKALNMAIEYWVTEDAPCVLADNCRLKVEEVDPHQCRIDAEYRGKQWRVSLSQGEGINGSIFVTCIDKVTGEVSDTYWVVS